MNLERLALARAQEQIDAGSWRETDADEALVSVPVECAICCGPLGNRRGGARMCPSCREAGWSVTPCKGCGGKLRQLDMRNKRESRRGYCQRCRVDMPQVHRGAETLKIARLSRWKPRKTEAA